MAIKAKLTADQFKALPDQMPKSELFTAQADGSMLAAVDAVDGFALENVSGLRSALEQERTTAAKYKPFEGLDPVAAKAALNEVTSLREQLKQNSSEAHKSQLHQLTQAHQTELSKLTQREAGLVKQLNRLLIDSEAATVMADPAIKGNPHLLMGPIRERTKVMELPDGNFRAVVVDKFGNERLTTSKDRAPTEPMTIRELIAEMRSAPEFAPAFGGSDSTGAGSKNSTAGGSESGVHTISAADALDPRKYQAAKQAAIAAKQQLRITE